MNKIPILMLLVSVLGALLGQAQASPNGHPELAAKSRVLEELGLETDESSLIGIAKENESTIAQEAAIAILGLRGVSEAKELLSGIMNTAPRESTRQEAALALLRIGDDAGKELLRGACNSHTLRATYLAAQLARHGDVTCFPSLLAAAESEERKMKLAALLHAPLFFSGLAEADQRRLVDFYEASLQSEDRGMRRAGLSAVQSSFRRSGLYGEEFRNMFESLAQRESDDELRKIVLRTLAQEAFSGDQ